MKSEVGRHREGHLHSSGASNDDWFQFWGAASKKGGGEPILKLHKEGNRREWEPDLEPSSQQPEAQKSAGLITLFLYPAGAVIISENER